MGKRGASQLHGQLPHELPGRLVGTIVGTGVHFGYIHASAETNPVSPYSPVCLDLLQLFPLTSAAPPALYSVAALKSETSGVIRKYSFLDGKSMIRRPC